MTDLRLAPYFAPAPRPRDDSIRGRVRHIARLLRLLACVLALSAAEPWLERGRAVIRRLPPLQSVLSAIVWCWPLVGVMALAGVIPGSATLNLAEALIVRSACGLGIIAIKRRQQRLWREGKLGAERAAKGVSSPAMASRTPEQREAMRISIEDRTRLLKANKIADFYNYGKQEPLADRVSEVEARVDATDCKIDAIFQTMKDVATTMGITPTAPVTPQERPRLRLVGGTDVQEQAG